MATTTTTTPPPITPLLWNLPNADYMYLWDTILNLYLTQNEQFWRSHQSVQFYTAVSISLTKKILFVLYKLTDTPILCVDSLFNFSCVLDTDVNCCLNADSLFDGGGLCTDLKLVFFVSPYLWDFLRSVRTSITLLTRYSMRA